MPAIETTSAAWSLNARSPAMSGVSGEFEPQARSDARGHVGGQDVGGVAVEVLAGPVAAAARTHGAGAAFGMNRTPAAPTPVCHDTGVFKLCYKRAHDVYIEAAVEARDGLIRMQTVRRTDHGHWTRAVLSTASRASSRSGMYFGFVNPLA